MEKTVQDFANRIKSFGFDVYVAERGNYGFITDTDGSRVLSFSFNDGGSLHGNYGPASQQSGTGWRMDQDPYQLQTKEDVEAALYARPPHFCGNGWKYLTTVEQHLKLYGDSSRYAKI